MSQADVLKYMEQNKVAEINEIVESLGITYSAVCANVRKLEKQNLIICRERIKRGNFMVKILELNEE